MLKCYELVLSHERAKCGHLLDGQNGIYAALNQLEDHFTTFIPNQRSINPITKTNWAGVGVIPDTQVDADKALLVLRTEILQQRIQTVTDTRERSEIVESILALKSAMKKL